jgi:DNA-binding transcriptional ArsR family regulator
MKNKRNVPLVRLFGTQSHWLCAIAIVAVIGFSMTACEISEDIDNTPDAFQYPWRIVNENGATVAQFNGNGFGKWDFGAQYESWFINVMRGTYKLSGKTVNLTVTHVNMPKLGDGGYVDFEEKPYSDLSPQQKEDLPFPQTFQGTISGDQNRDDNIFTVLGVTYKINW